MERTEKLDEITPNMYILKPRRYHKKDNGIDTECTIPWDIYEFQEKIALYNRVPVLFTNEKRWRVNVMKSLYHASKLLEIESVDGGEESQVECHGNKGPDSKIIANRVIFTRTSHNWDNELKY